MLHWIVTEPPELTVTVFTEAAAHVTRPVENWVPAPPSCTYPDPDTETENVVLTVNVMVFVTAPDVVHW